MANDIFLTAEEAAHELGVSVPTLYAYVSRKSLRSEKVPGARGRRYWRSDILRLEANAPPTETEPDVEMLCAQSAVTLITRAGPHYRGENALKLADASTLEDVAALLWRTPVEHIAAVPAPKLPPEIKTLRDSLSDLGPVDRAISLFPSLEKANPQAYDLSAAGFSRTGVDVLRWFAAILMEADPTDEPVHLFVARRAQTSTDLSDLVRRLLVLSADHELDPTTYAVRAVANTGVTPYRAVIAGFTAAMGRRLTYGRAQGLHRLMEEIITTSSPHTAIIRRLQEGELLPGFGNRLYPGGDPRAKALLAATRETFGEDAELKRLDAAIQTAAEAGGLEPDFSLPNAFIARKLKMNIGLMYLGRIVGWIAHADEQYRCELKRPRARYVGRLPAVERPAPSPTARKG